MSSKTLKGIGASPGIIIGKALVIDSEEMNFAPRPIKESAIPKEITRFQDALTKTHGEIQAIRDKIAHEMGKEHADIFTAHLMVLEDRLLIEEVMERIKKEKLASESIFSQVLKKYVQSFSKIDDEYLRERVSDISDVGRRIIRNLVGDTRSTLVDLKEKVIVVAYDLAPSDTAVMHRKNVIGFATDIGGRTSHTAIMAKSLEIPAVVGLEKATHHIQSGDTLILDGGEGVVVINPTPSEVQKYRHEQTRLSGITRGLKKLRDLPCITLDGHRVELAANIELPEEAASVLSHGADAIGLYRSEFLYMNRTGLPTEDEQYQAYKKVAMALAPRPVVVRTFDLGGDKFLSQLDMPTEMNPFLGWRAIRFCLASPDIFKVQMRAILRASAHGKLKMMYPMISGVNEIFQARKLYEECKAELRAKKIPFDERMEVGAMIEIPSAALTCDIIAEEVDFFSVGTNDLIQYSLAVDRINERIAYLYEPSHPAVLRLLKTIIEAGHEKKIWVGICGEMTADPIFTPVLVGLGMDEISTSPVMVPEIKRIIRSIRYDEAREIARYVLTLKSGVEVSNFLKHKYQQIQRQTRRNESK